MNRQTASDPITTGAHPVNIVGFYASTLTVVLTVVTFAKAFEMHPRPATFSRDPVRLSIYV